jgi:RNA polymerase sigma-70 factor (ECF subfamily)
VTLNPVTADVRERIGAIHAEEWGRIVATLIRLTGDWDLAEECAQDAFAQALERWPADGVPSRPGAWLTTTARNRALDRLRRATVEAAKLRELARRPEAGVAIDRDDRLELTFTCCHPALAPEAQVVLTLRCLAGLSTAEIARAFLVTEATMAQRLVRAKNKIRRAGIPFRAPPAALRAERTTAVLAVLYLLFNEGYAATAGDDLVRRGLTAEATRLTRMLCALLPAEELAEAQGALALMLLHAARHPGRVDADGTLVPLEEQDRSAWDAAGIADGLALLDVTLARRRPGPYQIQAAIAACHVSAPTAADTDWPQIALLYAELAKVTPSPVVELNRAVAVAMAGDLARGLAMVDGLADALAGYRLLPATRADLLRRMGRRDEAATAYREALAHTVTRAERRYLSRRLAEVSAG